MDILNFVTSFFNAHRLLLTISVISIFFVIEKIIIKFIIGNSNFLSEAQRKWISRTKNGFFSLIIILLFIIWRAEINEFALSLTAIAFALVVASKEIILCFTGSIQRASSQSFEIGQWIEIGPICGEVIEHNLIATKIQEIDLHHSTYNYTGKTVTFPNSLFFTTPVKNLNFMKRYVYHEFKVILKDTNNLFPLISCLLGRINEHCEDFYEIAKRYNQIIERHAGVNLPGADPQILISTSELGDSIVHVRIFCPTDRAIELEQLIREDCISLYCEYILKKKPIALIENDLPLEVESKMLHC